MTFAICLPIILQSEGGFSDLSNDPGGATNFGVTLSTLSQYLGEQASVGQLHALTPSSVAPIYEELYWHPVGCDVAPDGVDLMLFDMAVNQGQPTAIRTIQGLLGLQVDGVCGPNTRKALSACDGPSMINQISVARRERYLSAPHFDVFGQGWLSRLVRTTTLALQMAS